MALAGDELAETAGTYFGVMNSWPTRGNGWNLFLAMISEAEISGSLALAGDQFMETAGTYPWWLEPSFEGTYFGLIREPSQGVSLLASRVKAQFKTTPTAADVIMPAYIRGMR